MKKNIIQMSETTTTIPDSRLDDIIDMLQKVLDEINSNRKELLECNLSLQFKELNTLRQNCRYFILHRKISKYLKLFKSNNELFLNILKDTYGLNLDNNKNYLKIKLVDYDGFLDIAITYVDYVNKNRHCLFVSEYELDKLKDKFVNYTNVM